MDKNVKYIIYFFIGLIIYYLLFNDNRLVEGWECKVYGGAYCNHLDKGECQEWNAKHVCSCEDNGDDCKSNEVGGECDSGGAAAAQALGPGGLADVCYLFANDALNAVADKTELNWEDDVFDGCLRQRVCNVDCTGNNEVAVPGRTRYSGRMYNGLPIVPANVGERDMLFDHQRHQM